MMTKRPIALHRLSILANDMANVQARVDHVNQAVKQLEDSRHPRTKEIKDCQTRLNNRSGFSSVALFYLDAAVQLFFFFHQNVLN